jgi:hypothetical protein
MQMTGDFREEAEVLAVLICWIETNRRGLEELRPKPA